MSLITDYNQNHFWVVQIEWHGQKNEDLEQFN